MSKNKKTFVYTLQFNRKQAIAKVYRMKRNTPVPLGQTVYRGKNHKMHVVLFLIKKGHVTKNQKVDYDFKLEIV